MFEDKLVAVLQTFIDTDINHAKNKTDDIGIQIITWNIDLTNDDINKWI